MKTHTIDWSYYTGPVPGYGDTRPAPGEYACLLPDRYVESSFGGQTSRNQLPSENINYLRIPSNQGDGRMAGGGQTTDRVLEWQWPAGWVQTGTFYGPNAVIYGDRNQLVAVTSRAEYQETGGWRFVDGRGQLVSCIATYADAVLGVYEYTYWPDVQIGQGGKPDMGCVVAFDDEPMRLHRLDPRPVGQQTYPFNARFIRVTRDGDQFGICIVDLGARKTYFCWPTLAELRALPFVTDTPVPIPPEPPLPTDYLGINQRVRAKYPTPLGARHWEFLVDLAQQTGTLLFEKPGGAHVLIPPLGVYVSLDVVGRGSLGDNWADTLRDAEGAAVPIWDQHPNAAGTYINVAGVVLPGEPGPGPQPPDCEARVRTLEEALRETRAGLQELIEGINEVLR